MEGGGKETGGSGWDSGSGLIRLGSAVKTALGLGIDHRSGLRG